MAYFIQTLFIFVTALNAALAGLALTYSITLSGMFQFCLRQSSEVESLVSRFEANVLRSGGGTFFYEHPI